MNKQTEALKLALEALEDYVEEYGPHEQDSGVAYAITAIREALAEQPAISAGPITPAMMQGPTPEQKAQIVESMNKLAEQPAQQQAPVACRDEMCACRGGPCTSCPDGEREKELADMRDSRDFYKRRTDELQKAQSQMRDPERTMVCDILANGRLLVPAAGRYNTSLQPAQQQEPVAWMWRCKPYCGWPEWSVSLKRPADSGRDGHKRTEGYEDVPLYTSPPASKPLTDEEIKRMAAPLFMSHYWRLCNEFARAIEAAHGIKEKNT